MGLLDKNQNFKVGFLLGRASARLRLQKGMGNLKPTLLLAAVLQGLWAPLMVAAEVEAKKDGVEIYIDATNKSEVIGSLKSGETLESVERKGMFWQVKTKDGKNGFVSILAVKHKPDTNTNLAKAINGVVKGGRGGEDATESRARSAVMGVRGLREDDDMANAASVRPNLRAVYEMEDIKVSQKKVGELGDKVMGEITRKAESEK
jgi:hypothetical protein